MGTDKKRTPSIHTLKTDTQEVLTRRTSSVFSIAADAAKKRRAKNNEPEQSARGLLWLTALLLVVILIGGGYYYFTVLRAPKTPVEPNIPTAIIPPDETMVLRIAPGDTGGLLRAIEITREEIVPTNSLVYLPVRVDYSATSSAFLTGGDAPATLGLNFPTLFTRTLSDQWALYHEHRVGEVASALLLTTTNPGNAFAGLLSEEEQLDTNLKTLFQIDSTTDEIFRDELIQNIDTRISTASSTLGYGVFGGNVVIIASDESMLRTIISRLVAGPIRIE